MNPPAAAATSVISEPVRRKRPHCEEVGGNAHAAPGILVNVPTMLDTHTSGGGSLGLGAEEGRGKQRYAAARRMQPLNRRSPNETS